MFGLARASEYAGWWSGRPPAAAMTLTFTVDIPQVALVSPRYYGDFDGVANSGGQMGLNATGTNKDIDMTGVVNQPRRSVNALTFRVGTNFLATAGNSGFFDGIQNYHNLNSNGTDIFYNAGLVKNNGTYLIGQTNGARISLTAAQMDTYRDRWLGMVYATSNVSTDFSNWSGGSDTGNTNWASRVVVCDVLTGAIIGQNDAWSTQTYGNIDLTQQYTLNFGSSSYYDNEFVYWGGNMALYDRDESQVASSWFCVGSVLDPVDYVDELVGFGITHTVGSVQAWSYFYMDEAGTASGRGYSQPMPTGSRMPGNVNVFVQTAANASPVPDFVQIN